MHAKKNKTKEEKQTLVREFIASGKSKNVWCKEMNISVSTFLGWFKTYNKEKEAVSFISLKPMNHHGKSKVPSTITPPVVSTPLILEIGSYRIQVTEHISMSLLMEVLKVVKSSDV